MKKIDLTRWIARRSNLSQAAAADQLDRVVHRILKNLRRGKAVSLPGLGTFKPGATTGFEFLENLPGKGGRGGKKR
jgi:nucleoid DNA-binding protein